MPRLSVWLVRMSLAQLLVGTAIGGLILTSKGLAVLSWSSVLLPLHIEVVLVGWMVQLVLGVAYWILPRRVGSEPGADDGRVWLSFALLNLGAFAVGLGALVRAPVLIPGGRIAELLAAVAFATHAWRRVRPYRAGQTGAASAA